MRKRKIYMFQPAFLSGRDAYLPYAVGTLIAYAQQYSEIANHYEFADIFFMREDPDAVLSRISGPFYVGFSTYLWNIEYNKVLAERIKKKYPDCIIQFGGHQVYPGSTLLEECEYIDIAIHNEGEIPFALVLKELLKEQPSLESITNITYRKNGRIVNNPIELPEGENYPSPYLTGVFDRLIEEHPELNFIPMIETTRGCPNRCAYCGWGLTKTKVRKFPIERIYNEIKWISDHKCEIFGGCDANFGMFQRDEEIVDRIIKLKKETGFPVKFQVSYAKNSSLRVFEMTKKLNEAHMDKGVTLSFQSLDPTVLKNIGRSNISLDYYKKLLTLYRQAGIPTYSDLILGLPGETYASFIKGVDTLLKAGQHDSLFIHILEWLPCSAMGTPEYMAYYGIEYTRIPLNQPHRLKNDGDAVQEYSRIVTKTNTMSHDDWVKMNMFAACVLCFHHLGLLEFVALYCFYENKVDYYTFYNDLLVFLEQHPQTVAGSVFEEIKQRFYEVIEKQASVVFCNEKKYDPIFWPKEEYAFLEIISEKDRFYDEIRPFVSSFGIAGDVEEELMQYQSMLLKTINNRHSEAAFSYDFPSYFKEIFAGCFPLLKKKPIRLTIEDPQSYSNWRDYSRFVLWYGRRGGKNLYREEVSITDLPIAF